MFFYGNTTLRQDFIEFFNKSTKISHLIYFLIDAQRTQSFTFLYLNVLHFLFNFLLRNECMTVSVILIMIAPTKITSSHANLIASSLKRRVWEHISIYQYISLSSIKSY
uniref:Uncharacterized protein n=1 Tax=Glossina morsitans morsitans TaxID=37546 RepID=A0ABK9NG01_GLOMM